MNNSLISYTTFLKDRIKFKQSGGVGNSMNLLDTPSHNFFKILFYFANSDTDYDNEVGLLSPTWLVCDGSDEREYYNYNTAWSYLKMNDENERADKLKQFITLLSNINCNSPWYFSEIEGVDSAIQRLNNGDIKFEERKKITIKCLPDAMDQRIETLLNLYRDITWSWKLKREILPSNLRKFDMGLYIWESPIKGIHAYRPHGGDWKDSVLDENSEEYATSYKLLEFHNCEIDYDSVKSGYSTMTNKEGFQKEFSIDIYFDDVYEHNYNSILMRTIGDVIETDSNNVISVEQGSDDSKYNKSFEIERRSIELQNRIEYWNDDQPYEKREFNEIDRSEPLSQKSFKNNKYNRFNIEDANIGDQLKKASVNLGKQAVGYLVDDTLMAAKRLLLGNLYTYSLSRMADQLKGALHGNLLGTMAAIDQYADTNIINTLHNNSLNNKAATIQANLNNKVSNRKLHSDPPQQLGTLKKSLKDNI